MALKTALITLPHDSLRTRSKRIGYVDTSVHELIEAMEQATLDWEKSRKHEVGVALAAIQINVDKRVVVIREDFGDKKNTNFEVFINPEIVKYEGEIIEDYEGCLSVKDVYGKVPRYGKVKVKALDINGKSIRVTAEGFLARVFQHEIDHTNGILFVDRIKDTPGAFSRLLEDGSMENIQDEEFKNLSRILW
jgi:peptide deformylase